MDESLNKKEIHFTQNRNKKIKGYNLFRNYPNPFNPSTTIPFEIQRGGYTTLEVYSTLGQKISTLLNGIKESGIMK